MIYEPIYPFDASNLDVTYRPLVTPSYFDQNGSIPLVNGNPKKVASGWNTNWPVGLYPEVAHDLNTNVKSMWFKVNCVFEYEDSFIGFGFTSTETLNAQGLIRRFYVAPGTMFHHKFKSVNNVGNTTNAITIDFTQSFYDYRSFGFTQKNYWWFPYINFEIAGNYGYITKGTNLSPSMGFDDFKVNPIPSIPITVLEKTPGISIGNPVVFESSIVTTERYDMIYFSPEVVAKGSLVTIVCPPYKEKYDSPAQRTGFKDLVSISFGDSTPVTNFTKITNDAGVVDQVTVVVPQDANTGTIKFKSVSSETNPENTTDYYETRVPITIV